jgi:hypothetical protein
MDLAMLLFRVGMRKPDSHIARLERLQRRNVDWAFAKLVRSTNGVPVVDCGK